MTTQPDLTDGRRRALETLAGTPSTAFALRSIGTNRPHDPTRSALIYWQTADWLVAVGYATRDGRRILITPAGVARARAEQMRVAT